MRYYAQKVRALNVPAFLAAKEMAARHPQKGIESAKEKADITGICAPPSCIKIKII